MLKPFRILCVLAVGASTVCVADAEEPREVYETEIDADITAVWNAFTTEQGVKMWMAPLAEVDFRVGGLMKTNYDPNGEIGDENTIENTILAYDPGRMIAMKATGFPKGFPFVEAARSTWSVFYFSELPDSRTRVTVVGLGYTDEEMSQQMRSFFASANKFVLDKLNAALKEQKNAESEK